MFNTHLHKVKKFYWLLLLPFVAGVFITSCGDTPVSSETSTSVTDSSDVNTNIDFTPENFNAVGKIQGTVIDKSTGEALSDVAVTLQFFPDAADEPSVITDSTQANGFFSYSGVPVNTNSNHNGNNSPYTLEINTGELDNYRDVYRMNAVLTFEPTGGDGSATNLVSDVTVPLSEQSVTLKGKAHDTDDATLSDVRVELYQIFNPVINGNQDEKTRMLVDSSMTESDGSFEFTGVEENAEVLLQFVDNSDPSEAIDMEYTVGPETPSADEDATPELDLGRIIVGSSNQSGAFYITDVTPEPGSDISSTDTSFVYVFNRSVAENPYTQADRGFGSGTFKDGIEFTDDGPKKSPGDVEFSVSWSNNRDSLTITPEDLTDATEYVLDVDDALDDQRFIDEYNNTLTWGVSEYDPIDVVFLNFSTGVNGSMPHTPELTLQEGDSSNFDGGVLNYSWEVDESAADVKEYEVWRQFGDNSYERVEVISRSDISFGEVTRDFAPTVAVPLVSASGNIPQTGDTPDGAVTHSYKVRAISANLTEGEFSNEATFADSVQPNITEAPFAADVVNINFDEPMVKSQAEDVSNYSFADDQGDDITDDITITDISYIADYNDDGYVVLFNIEDADNLSEGYTVTLSDVTDLAGNELNTAEATFEDFAPHTPTIAVSASSPTAEPNVNYNSGDVILNWELMEDPPAEVEEYQVWVKQSNEDDFSQQFTVPASNAEFGELTTDVSPFLGNPLVTPNGVGENPDQAITKEYKIRAVSTDWDGEFSNVITVADTVQPSVIGANYIGGTEVTVDFAEPMQKSLAEDADNYTFFDAEGTPGDTSDDSEIDVTIEAIEYDGSYDNNYSVTIFLETGDNVDAGVDEYVEVSSDVTDLAGNDIDTDNNTATY